jgi:hypothetical protein
VPADDNKASHWIEWRERKSLSVLMEAWDTLGIDEEDLLIGDERMIKEKLDVFLEAAPKPRAATPFYERDQ